MADAFTKALEEFDAQPVAERKTAVVSLGGRDITLRQFNETQFMQLQHETLVLKRSEDGNMPFERVQKSLDRVFRAIRSAIPDEEQRDYIDDLMAEGELDLRELVRAVFVFNREAAVEDEKPVQVRRGRPRRAR